MISNLVFVGSTFFQDSWQHKLGEILSANDEDKWSYLVHDRYAVACKNEIGKLLGMFPNMYRSKCISFIKYSERVEMKVIGKWGYSKDLQQGLVEILCMFSVSSEHRKMLQYYKDLKNMPSMSCQRNENRVRKWFVVYKPIYSCGH